MNTILTVVLQISGGLRTEVNSFLSEYAVPVIAMLLIVGVCAEKFIFLRHGLDPLSFSGN